MNHNYDQYLSKKYYMKFSDGSVWAIPLIDLMMFRAQVERGDDDFEYLYSTILPNLDRDWNEFIQWVRDHVSWSAIRVNARMITPPALDYDAEMKGCQVKIN